MFHTDFQPPNERRYFVHKRVIGAVGGFLGGGVGGAVKGFVEGGRSNNPPPSRTGTPGARQFDLSATTSGRPTAGGCARGEIKIGGRCFDPPFAAGAGVGLRSLIPSAGGDDGTVVLERGGAAVVGAFGMPARVPMTVERMVRLCGRGMVLGTDDLCYPKAVLQKRSRHRKWRAPIAPVMTGADKKIIRRAESLRDEVKELNKAVGLRVPTIRTKAK